jgi:hypothetical protein
MGIYTQILRANTIFWIFDLRFSSKKICKATEGLVGYFIDFSLLFLVWPYILVGVEVN